MNGYFSKDRKSRPGEADPAFREARERMVDFLRQRGIEDANVLRAMGRVPRQEFIPGNRPPPDVAYGDYPFPIGNGQTISQPFIIAYMTQRLAVKPGQRVLEVGSGCGYQAAILAEIGAAVTGIERMETLAVYSRQVLQRLGYDSVRILHGDGYQGDPESAPYERILVSCAPPDIPENLLQQLAEDGRMMAPVGIDQQMLTVVERRNGRFSRHEDLAVRFVPMIKETERKTQDG